MANHWNPGVLRSRRVLWRRNRNELLWMNPPLLCLNGYSGTESGVKRSDIRMRVQEEGRSLKKIRVTLLFSLLVTLPIGLIAQNGESEKKEAFPEAGVYISRSDGSFLNLRLVERKFRIYFMDGEKHPVDPPDARVIVRYENVARRDRDETRALKRVDGDEGTFFSSPQNIRPPWDFWVTIIVKYTDRPDDRELYPRVRFRHKD